MDAPGASSRFTVLGFVGGLYLLIKDALQDNRDKGGKK